MTKTAYSRHVMADKEHGATFTMRNILHLANSFLLELSITDSEDFIDNEDFGFHKGSDSEAKADSHTA